MKHRASASPKRGYGLAKTGSSIPVVRALRVRKDRVRFPAPRHMNKQKGQIHIILLVLLILGFILYINFSDRSLLKFILPSSQTKSTPTQRQLTPGVSPSTPGVAAPAPAPLTPGVDGGTPGVVVPVTPAQPLEDRTPPVRSNPSHQASILPEETNEVVISISTDEPASCRYTTSQGSSSYSSMSWYDQTKRFHVKTITGLRNSVVYDFFIRCQDFNGNSNTGDVLISFTIKP